MEIMYEPAMEAFWQRTDMRYFINPSLHESFQLIETCRKKRIFEKDPFARYIYEQMDGYLKRRSFSREVAELIDRYCYEYTKLYNKFIKTSNDDPYWETEYPKAVKSIKESCDTRIMNIDHCRQRVMANFVSECWSDARDFGIEITLNRTFYSNLTVNLFILANYCAEIKGSMQKLADLRKIIIDMNAEKSFLQKFDSFSKYNGFDHIIANIDKFIEHYQRFDETYSVIKRVYAKKI